MKKNTRMKYLHNLFSDEFIELASEGKNKEILFIASTMLDLIYAILESIEIGLFDKLVNSNTCRSAKFMGKEKVYGK